MARLLRLLGGQQTMLESPLLQKFFAEKLHEVILDVLKDRFGTVPRDVTKLLRAVIAERKLRKLTVLAAKCPDVEAFREALLA